MNKTKYFLFFYDQAGFNRFEFWKELTEDEVDQLTEDHGCLESAYADENPDIGDDLFWVMSADDVLRVRNEADEVLKEASPELFCERCEHSLEDHTDGETEGGHCWHGSGNGNRCACDEFENEKFKREEEQ